jgi:RimJ/RimL family protein N-acetyltransferase
MVKMVHIRPIRESELDQVTSLFQDPDQAGPQGFFGYRDPSRLRRRFAENGLLGDDQGRLAVALGEPAEPGEPDEFIGEVSWHRVSTGPVSFTFNFGIALMATARGHGHGTRAQRLLAEYLFAHTLVNRVEASTEVDNVAERRSLEKAGFTLEGVVRGACFRAGRWRDMASYSMVRADLG